MSVVRSYRGLISKKLFNEQEFVRNWVFRVN